jgi:hypothetical protein
MLGIVEVKRIPRLVRVGKETVVVGSERPDGERDDGAFYSKGNTLDINPSTPSSKQTNSIWNIAIHLLDPSNLQPILLGLGIGFGIVALRSCLKK